jgi:hypothetical protein
MESNEKCWCGHQAQWHERSKVKRSHKGDWLYICQWCIKLELRGKKYCDHEHEMATDIPDWMQNEVVAKLDAMLSTPFQYKSSG